MLDRRAQFALAVAELGRQASKLAEEDDRDVRVSRATMLAALRAAEDLAAAARESSASAEAYDAAARAVERVADALAAERARRPRRLAVVLEVTVEDKAST